MYVTISPDEFSIAVQVANSRMTQALKNEKKERRKGKDWVDSLGSHVIGVVGEMSVAKALRLPFSGSVDTFKAQADVGKDIEVKHRSSLDWDMILRPHDNKDSIFVLSRGLPPGAIEVAGWITGEEAMVDKWWAEKNNLRPAWWIPAEALHPMEEWNAG